MTGSMQHSNKDLDEPTGWSRMIPNPTPIVAAAGLIGGFQAARATGNRTMGGLVLATCGAGVFLLAKRLAGTGKAVALSTGYLAAFGASHPLAKKLGAWPSVLTVTAATVIAAGILARPR